ncbi:D-glycero-beta-D-manno-heptose 1,7-bisphosphate 7-phosphatase [Marinobacter sp. NP-4(2019)]|uniref:D-glycero-beta-D-manno-heptose 1,7-bisphosphate 7-phosphatase n=1 Tax=Marinobacter sp. NP-4(2019) TaxID=2488665 RepID=UPI000FC3DEB3|nr:D-glycero-beta-D-manno-heptose 1,7-bisphosphate 7-phosphatase [Marinobacter sp. NP-4(2019)]AZT82098.1 D-glycero-beta-D-manno-heptose 1,7-bisphosphate 7-phosphatase [Marinobacter sp. NP-4(2019)]
MLIILDRDGVINQYDGNYICSADEWIPIPGSIEAIARLCNAGHRIAIATNQSGIARGYYDIDALDAMHEKLEQLVEAQGGCIDFIAHCPHHPDDHCACRKPLTGMLDQIRDHFHLDSLQGAFMVGDSRKDLEAGLAEDCRPVLVLTGNGVDTAYHLETRPLPDVRQFDNLAAFADWVISTNL